jgi:hypothetical protein
LEFCSSAFVLEAFFRVTSDLLTVEVNMRRLIIAVSLGLGMAIVGCNNNEVTPDEAQQRMQDTMEMEMPADLGTSGAEPAATK